MDTQALVQYATKRLQSGVSKSEMSEELTALGWNENEIEEAYRGAVISLGGPLPSVDNRPALARKAGAVDIVINFFSFILLGITATALGTLYFQVINHFFPDVLDATTWYVVGASTDAIHYATAALIIGFPLYYAALRLWFRKFREDEGRVESKLSKWLTYVVLLVAAVTIVGDLITLVYTLLQGEITTRFFLKALVILGLAGGIFGFYYLERRKIQYRANIPRYVFQRFGIGTSVLVVVGIVLGFVAGGSPMTERDRSLDETRASHLSTLAGCIEQYAGSYQHLPKTLDEFRQYNEFNYCLSSMNDPETGETYGYRIITPSLLEGSVPVGEYELCANFALESTNTQSPPLYGSSSVWYEHGVGKSCDRAKAKLSQMNPFPTGQPAPIVPTVQIESSPSI